MIFGKFLLQENRGRDEGIIEGSICKFYEHMAKWKFIPNKQESSWLNSIYASIKELHEKQNSPAAFKGYIIANHKDDINKEVLSRLSKNNPDLTIFKLEEIYSEFPTKEDIMNKDKVNKFLEKYQVNKTLILR